MDQGDGGYGGGEVRQPVAITQELARLLSLLSSLQNQLNILLLLFFLICKPAAVTQELARLLSLLGSLQNKLNILLFLCCPIAT